MTLLFWSLRHRRWNHVMNGIAMVITAAVVMLFVSAMLALWSAAKRAENNELTRVLVLPAMLGGEQPVALEATLKDIEGIRVIQKYRRIAARHPNGATYLVIGEEHTGIELNTDFFPVEPAVFEAWKTERIGAIVSEATARELNLVVGQLAEVPTPSGPLQIKVVGLSHRATIGKRIAVHYAYLSEFVKNQTTARFRVFTKPADYERVARDIAERTRNSPSPVRGVSAATFAASQARQAGMVPAVLGFLGIFLVLVTALTLANNSALNIRARRIETATMRVLGYQRSTIVKMLLGEAMLVGLIGGIVAVIITLVAFRSGLQLTPGEVELLEPVKVGLPGIIAGLIVSVAVPLAGVLPAAVGSVRVPLATALRDAA